MFNSALWRATGFGSETDATTWFVGKKPIETYASPRQATVALMRHMGGDEKVRLNFLCGAGIASES